jgi:hypothetical protein
MIGGGQMIQRSVESDEGVELVLLLEEKGRDLSYQSLVYNRVEWLYCLSGGALRFAPFLQITLWSLILWSRLVFALLPSLFLRVDFARAR